MNLKEEKNPDWKKIRKHAEYYAHCPYSNFHVGAEATNVPIGTTFDFLIRLALPRASLT